MHVYAFAKTPPTASFVLFLIVTKRYKCTAKARYRNQQVNVLRALFVLAFNINCRKKFVKIGEKLEVTYRMALEKNIRQTGEIKKITTSTLEVNVLRQLEIQLIESV